MSEGPPEDSMQELSYQEEESTGKLTPYRKEFDQVDKMLAQAVNLSGDSRMHEPTCPICNSPLRAEAEDMYERNPRDLKAIKQFFKERSNLNVSVEIIKHHMKDHKDGGVKEIRKVEFIDRVRRLYNSDTTSLDQINLCLGIITERIMEINSLGPDNENSVADIEKMKTSETTRLMGQYSKMIQLRATILGEMRDNGEIISIQQKRFIDVFNTALINAKTDREKELVQQILEGLRS